MGLEVLEYVDVCFCRGASMCLSVGVCSDSITALVCVCGSECMLECADLCECMFACDCVLMCLGV